jgi:hypothetical protein
MNEIVERVAKAMWDVRRAHANNAGIFLEFWGDGTIPRANGIMEEARAAIEAIESGGYRIIKAVEPGEADRPGFDLRSYEVGYMEGENSANADADLK